MAGILLVDNPETRTSCVPALKGAGHECRYASCGAEAMRALFARRPDLVLLNPHLDNREGLRTLEAIKQFDPELCVMLYSEASLFGDSFDYFLANGTLVKQADHRQLLAFVEAKFSQTESLHYQGDFF